MRGHVLLFAMSVHVLPSPSHPDWAAAIGQVKKRFRWWRWPHRGTATTVLAAEGLCWWRVVHRVTHFSFRVGPVPT